MKAGRGNVFILHPSSFILCSMGCRAGTAPAPPCFTGRCLAFRLPTPRLAGGAGFEPAPHASKAHVLPLDDPPSGAAGWAPTSALAGRNGPLLRLSYGGVWCARSGLHRDLLVFSQTRRLSTPQAHGSAGGCRPRALRATNAALWLAELQRIRVVPAAGFAPAASSV